MGTGPGKKPGTVGRKSYRNPATRQTPANNDTPQDNNTSQDNDAAKDEDTPMTEDTPEVEKSATGRPTRSCAKRKSPTDSDASKVQPQPQRKKKKTDGAASSNSAHQDIQSQPQLIVQGNDGAESSEGEPGATYKNPADFVANFIFPKKRKMNTSPDVRWDFKTNRPTTMVKIGYENKEEEKGAYIKQTPVPLPKDRLIPKADNVMVGGDSAQPRIQPREATLSQPTMSPKTPKVILHEIEEILKELNGKLDPIQDLNLDYSRTDLERDSNKEDIIVSDPQRQLPKRALHDKVNPFSNITDIFSDIAVKAEGMGFLQACKPFEKQGLHVVTMCSGTESPLLALDLLKRAFIDRSHLLNIQHVASAEIIPFKQAYIHRNFNPKLLFRDVTEFCDQDAKPHTAFGGKAEQPKNIHMLIAGSSCIDYSTLNNKKKEFGEKGQSFSTLKGIAAYCFRAKPPVVILENVDGAPWPQILDLYKDIGYTGLVFKVDSKDFYIPQTRTRGYMVAFHTQTAKRKNFVLKQMFESVVASLNQFKQRATVPYTHFMYSDDDPDLSIARHKLITAATENGRTAMSWTACRHRYAAYRKQNQLGSDRPYTQWRADGTCRPLDIAWVDWIRVQRERIWETIDINFLHYLRQREYDMSYKSRWLELSQNVDRDNDQRQWGITNCLTPSGMPMDSRRGGPVTGRESLALQGIPADKLLLNKETSSQMQDMAGNAMTTTVVGSVIFSAIIACLKKSALKDNKDPAESDSLFQQFSTSDDKGPESQGPPIQDIKTLEDIKDNEKRFNLRSQSTIKPPYQPPAMTEVAKLAAMAMQLCRCEGALGKTSSRVSICPECSSTCCAACKGNPQHIPDQLVILDVKLLESRATAADFHKYVQERFPPAIDVLPRQSKVNLVMDYIAKLQNQLESATLLGELNFVKRLKSKFTQYEEAEIYLKTVANSLKHTFTLAGIKRDKIIRVIYESPTARLEFQVQFDRTRFLSQRREWTDDLVACAWLLFAKAGKELGAGSPVREALESPVLRMEPKAHLLDTELQFRNLLEQEFTVVITPRGISQETAWESSLGISHPDYQNIQTWPELEVQAVDFDNDCQPIIDSINGVYKSLSSCGGANGTLHVKIDQSNEYPPSTQGPYSSGMFLFLDPAPFRNASLDSMVFSNIHERLPYGVSRRVQATITPEWRPFKLQSLNEEPTEKLIAISATTDQIWGQSGYFLSISSQAENTEKIHANKPFVKIDSTVCHKYSSIVACRLPRLHNLPPDFATGKCLDIEVINQPEAMKALQWYLSTNWRSSSLEDWHELTCEPSLLTKFLECGCNPEAPKLKWRLATASKRDTMIIKPFEDPEAATVYERASKAISAPVKALLHCHDDDLVFDLQLNLDSVVHRVVASLTRESSAQVDLRWRLARDSGLENFPRLEKINVPGYDSAYPSIGSTPGLKSSCQLTAWQRQSARWMEQQELADTPWCEFERLESRLPALQQRLDVEGMKKVCVKGGILADAVGSGKTLTSMILAARDACDEVKADHAHRDGLVPLRATLFLVPSTLFDQWREEKEKFIDDTFVCRYIEKHSDLLEYSVKDFKKAHFIFVSQKVFEEPSYWDQFRRTTNAFNVPSLASRGFHQWLQEASKDLRDLITNSEVNGKIDLSKFNQARKDRRNEFEEKYKEQFSAFRKACITKSQTSPEESPSNSVPAVNDSVDEQSSDKGKGKKAAAKKAASAKQTSTKKPYKNAPKKKAIVAKNIAGAEAEVKKRQTELYQPAQPQARGCDEVALDYDAGDWSATDLDELKPLLHMFSYRRLVVDEFTYLRDQNVSAVVSLSAQRRWMLSGTPPVHDYIGIAYMAKLLGTKITPQGDNDVLINFIKTNKSLVHDKTSAEEFQQHLQTQSPAWVRMRNVRAKAFVDQFVRQNHRETTESIKYHLKVSKLSLIESYLYNKAFYSVNVQVRETESIGGQKLQSNAVLSRDAPFLKYFEKNKSAVGAMMWSIPLLLNEYTVRGPLKQGQSREIWSLEQLITEKDDVFVELMVRITKTLATALSAGHSDQMLARQKATPKIKRPRKTKTQQTADDDEQGADDENGTTKTDEKNSSLAVYLENILNHQFGDRSVSEVLSRVAKACSSEYAAICAHLPTGVEVGAKKEVATQKELAIALNALTREAVQIAQERRLLKQVLALGLNPVTKCHMCGKEVRTSSTLTVMSLCGHTVCTECLSSENYSSELLNGCPVLGCSGPGKDSGIPAVRFSRAASEVGVGGTKVSHLLQVLRTIRQNSAGARVLVFLQGERQKEMVAAIKTGFGPNPRAVVDATPRGDGSAAKVSNFGKNKDARVLILPIDDINAAGWNLQSCNHVVFVRPFVSTTRADWLATRKQAIGRCARHGQSQTVHVYDLLSSATLEMELFQVRLAGRLELGDEGWAFQPGRSPDFGEEVVGPRLESLESLEEGGEEEEEEE